ncbi:hypothetical protein HN592_03540 [Candidatus Woesearchaeota archaeon]|jgi:hypothetical protein|nr:hypothetical protein [Candidatus Woesearchaeota archaeon]MBT4368285.1 hypothetical protein [Candidatus Woesearchaeota archaeon]MBT4712774.1 hypothetical protein [Candidatus Woesearchaeota archaeon]MBT6639686.1 hypothetical protein [Candidatus Woesearchaeota archaeon]MBT7133858.1 hypothetical protein [Candidatus Woesearchaeota archaeon]
MNNKGISIAINQVVIIIISLVILGLGVTIAFNVVNTADAHLPGITQQTQDQLEKALSSGKIVEIPSSTKGGRAKDLTIFNLGVKNDPFVTQGNESFHVIISFNKAIKKSGAEICTTDACKSGALREALIIPEFNPLGGFSIAQKFNIRENEVKAINFGVQPKQNEFYAGIGQYFYNVCVCNGDGDTFPVECTTKPTAGGMAIDECNAANYGNLENAYGFVTFSVIVQ